MSQAPTIERMRLSDVPRVMEIERQSFPTPWSESAYITEISNQSACYVVARLEGDVVGYAGMWVIMDEAHITTIAVDARYRGRKFGELLLVALLDESMAKRLRRATLEVRQSNRVAQKLYVKYGFDAVAVRKAYYANNNEDALVMWVHDLLAPEYRSRYRELRSQLERSLGQTPSASRDCDAQ